MPDSLAPCSASDLARMINIEEQFDLHTQLYEVNEVNAGNHRLSEISLPAATNLSSSHVEEGMAPVFHDGTYQPSDDPFWNNNMTAITQGPGCYDDLASSLQSHLHSYTLIPEQDYKPGMPWIIFIHHGQCL